MVVVVPSVLQFLIHEMLDDKRAFDRTGLQLLGIFPFTLMFLITSVAMLRERTSGTLERLLTTPMSKLDLLLGYGIAFAVMATVQATVTSATAYLLLDLYTPGSAAVVILVAISGAVLGMALGLLTSAFATTEFQAVQFFPAVVLPQVLLGGLFRPREQMADWMEAISNGMPLTYVIKALEEVGKTSLLTGKLLGDTGVVIGAALGVLALAASTLRRRAGELPRAGVLALRAVPVAVLLVSATLTAAYFVDAQRYVRTDDATIDGDRIPITAPANGTLVGWDATHGSDLRKGQAIGRIELAVGGSVRPQRVLRAPADGTVVRDNVVAGAYVSAGTELAVAYDLSEVYVTARIDETDIGAVHPGQQVDISVDGYPRQTFVGYVEQIQGGTSQTFSTAPKDNSTGSFEKVTQVIPVKITVVGGQGMTLVPGMNVEVRIHKD
jgi:ABC-2 type transport system permease protein